MKGKLLFLCLLTALPLCAQQNYQILQMSFLPREFYVGDVVELRIELRLSPGVEIEIPDVLPNAGWFIVRNIQVQPRGETQELRISFTSFQPGIRVIPPLEMGAVVLDGIRVDTSSILARGNPDFAPMADPLYLPRTSFFFAVILGALLGLPLFFLFLSKRFAAFFRTYRTTRRRRRPYLHLMKELKELDRTILNRDGNLFYTRLVGAFKAYFSARMGIEFDSFTSREINRLLENHFSGEAFLEKLNSLFLFGDEVKFAGTDPYTSRKKADLNTAENALMEIEKYYRNIWIKQERENKKKSKKKKELSHVDR